jgi:hypothetical protein
MADSSEPAWPLRFITLPDGSVHLAEVAQGSPQAREGAAAVVICTPRGYRDDDPTFGITPLTFQQGRIDTSRLAGELAQSDPSLSDIDVTEALDLLHVTERTVRVDVGQDGIA